MPEALAAVIFDRDGVLNVDHGYVGEVERLEWIPGARRAVARLSAAGVKVIVATNQSGVARGYFDMGAVDALHDAMRAALAAEGGRAGGRQGGGDLARHVAALAHAGDDDAAAGGLRRLHRPGEGRPHRSGQRRR